MNMLPATQISERRPLPLPFVAPPTLLTLLEVLEKKGGRGVLVGGCVRDHLLGLPAKDLDVEVYGLELDEVQSTLEEHFTVLAVGKAFGILKVIIDSEGKNHVYDVALPRLENKEGFGHKGFVVTTNKLMPFKDAAARRDFTINAMGIDVVRQELLDAHNGLENLNQGILKHISQAFVEDPLRVLRAAQFAARFNFTLAAETIELCRELSSELLTLSKERIYEEMKKLLLAQKPSTGFNVLRQTDALILFPELAAMIDCAQDPEWHPEGDVWIHTLMVIDQAAKLIRSNNLDEESALIIMAGALCHDIGKAPTTKVIDGRIRSLAHDEAGATLTPLFLSRMAFPPRLIPEIEALVREHLKPYQLYRTRDIVSDGALRRLALRVNIDHLLLVSQADFLGRTTSEALQGHDPSAPWLRQEIKRVLGADLAPKALILGRHLIALGYKPGPDFTTILAQAFEAQLDGTFVNLEDGLVWLKAHWPGPK